MLSQRIFMKNSTFSKINKNLMKTIEIELCYISLSILNICILA